MAKLKFLLRASPKKTFYYRVLQTLYLKFQGNLLQKQNFKFNFKTSNLTSKLFVNYTMLLIFVIININP